MPLMNPYFSQGYNNPYGQSIHQYQQSMPMQQPQTTTFYNVPSEEVARRWEVLPNSTVRFMDDNREYFYAKSVGMSILEPPVFKKFRIIEEVDEQPISQTQESQTDLSEYIKKSDFEPYKAIIDDMQDIIKELKGDG